MKATGVCMVVLFVGMLASAKAQQNPKHEMRAVWIATVENIDWPSKPGLPVRLQKREMKELLDLVVDYHLNTVILQIRPAADAFYPSALEPWSMWLTGEQGKAPEPFYDPLAFVISACRQRGLDIHVWLNPYRALRDTTLHVASPDHISRVHPEWFLTYGTTRYFDPGLPQTREHVSRVVSDIVRRYDIDAIHMDDYFYPYRIAHVEFPDDGSFAKYHGDFTEEQRDDWRRNNVDMIIKQLHDSIKAIKPWVDFGISPFGVWRNAHVDSTGSATRAGQTNYDDLFADVLKWQKEGWIDYVTPQLYWQIGMPVADYQVLAVWWNKNTYGCPLYIGHGIYRLDPNSQTLAWRSSDEIINQLKINRSLENIAGSVFYSAKFLRSNPLGLKQNLKSSLYQHQALQPVKHRYAPVHATAPAGTTVRKGLLNIRLNWQKGGNTKVFVIYRFKKGELVDFTNPANIFRVTADVSLRFRSDRTTRLSRFSYGITALSTTGLETNGVLFAR